MSKNTPMKQRHGLWPSLAFGAMVFLGACEMVMTQAHHHGSDVINRFQYASAGRDFTTVIVGNPFSVPNQTFGRMVTDAMQNKHFGAVMRDILPSRDPGEEPSCEVEPC